jgi:uncharacterized membrane protein
MADLIAIGYDDESTAAAPAQEGDRLAQDLIIEPDAVAVIVREKVTPDKAIEGLSPFGGTVLKSSLSKDVEHDVQEALHGSPVSA